MSELIMKSRVKNYRKQIYIDVCKMPFIDEEKNMSETREECKRGPESSISGEGKWLSVSGA